MTQKTTQTSKPKKQRRDKQELEAVFAEAPDPQKARAMAKLALRPSVNAAAVLETYATTTLGDQDIGAIVAELSAGAEDLSGGNMKRAEAMLYSQAHALQAIFMNLSRRAASQEYLKQWEAYMRMALKAQNQCRMTLETLATIKNPPVVIARQANINNGGQQQVNNGATQPAAGPQGEGGTKVQALENAETDPLSIQGKNPPLQKIESGAPSRNEGSGSVQHPRHA